MHPRDPYQRKVPNDEEFLFQARLFHPDALKSKTWQEKYLLVLLVLSIVLDLISMKFIPEIVRYVFILSGGIIAVCSINSIRYAFLVEPLEGEFGEPLKIFRDRIEFGKKKVIIQDMKDIQIETQDYYGKDIFPKISWRYLDRPNLSQGIRNQIQMELKSGETIHHNFQIESEGEMESIKPFILNCVRIGAMTIHHASLHLEIEGEWEPIQELKKEVGKPLE